jgi:hypothetical protein
MSRTGIWRLAPRRRRMTASERLAAAPPESMPPELQEQIRARFGGKVEIHPFGVFLGEEKLPVGEWALESLDLDPILEQWEGQIEISARFYAHDERGA